MAIFDKVSDIQFLKIIPEIVDEYRRSWLNFNERIIPIYNRRSTIAMTAIHIENIAVESKKKFGTEKEDIEHIREFFVEEILGQSADQVIRNYQKLFQDIKYEEIKSFLIDKITQFKANDFDFFSKMVGFAITKQEIESVLEFWFDLANNFQDNMAEQNLLMFCKLFDVGLSSPVKFPLSKEDFIEVFAKEIYLSSRDSGTKLHALTQTKFMIIGLMGIKQKGDISEQHQAVCAVLGQNYDEEYELERYIT